MENGMTKGRKGVVHSRTAKNLFLVGQAVDKDFVTTYTRNACYLENNSGEVVLTGARINKLYRLELRVVRPGSQANMVIGESSSSRNPDSTFAKFFNLWHQRFGHINNATIYPMHTDEGLNLVSHTLPDNPYKGCAFGKNKRRLFPKKNLTSRTAKAGSFFHTDVCGPISQASVGGAKYFALFKDDYTRYKFVFYIKNKYDVFNCFKTLCGLVTQQTGNKIEKLRSDR
jgi:hypothetical protein